MAEFKVVLKLNGENNTEFTIDKNKINNFSSIIQTSSSPEEINYDTLATSGRIEIVDTDSEIRKLIEEQGIDNKVAELDVYLNDNKIQTHRINDDFGYNIDDNTFSFSLTNTTQSIEMIQFYDAPTSEGSSSTLYSSIVYALTSAGFSQAEINTEMSKKIIVPFDNSWNTVENYLKSITTSAGSYIINKNLKDALKYYSQICQLNILIDEEGKLKIIPILPKTGEEHIDSVAIRIPRSNIYGDFTYSPIRSGKFEGLSYVDYSIESVDEEEGYYVDSGLISVSQSDDLESFLNNNYPSISFTVTDTHIIGEFTSYPNVDGSIVYFNKTAEPFYKVDYTISGTQRTESGELDEFYSYSDFISYLDTQTSQTHIQGMKLYDDFTLKRPSTFYFAIKKANLTSFQFQYGAPVEYDKSSKSNQKNIGERDSVNLLDNTLINSNLSYGTGKIVNYIYNALSDSYGSGRKTAYTTICYSDLYYKDGSIAVNTENGDLLTVGAIVYFDADYDYNGNQRYWKVTSREVYYDAAFYYNLQMVETDVVDIYYPAGLYDENKMMMYDWNYLVNNGYIEFDDVSETWTQPFSETSITRYLYRVRGVQEWSQIGIIPQYRTLLEDLNGSYLIIPKMQINYEVVSISSFGKLAALKGVSVQKDKYVTGDNISGNYLPFQIENNAFEYCTSLENIRVDGSVGGLAFTGCESLKNAEVSGSVGNNSFSFCESLEYAKIGNGVDSYAFQGCTNLKNVDIEKGNIGEHAFDNCTSLKNVSIPNTYYTIEFITTGQNAGYSREVKVYISIGESAFANCSSLEGIEFDDNISSIGENAFYGCTALAEFSFPNSITSISAGVLSNCTGLSKITIPASVTSIGSNAFSGCSAVNNIYIPSSVTTISASGSSYSPFATWSPVAVIYCGAASQPSGYGTYWDYYTGAGRIEVKWGYTREQYEQEVNI